MRVYRVTNTQAFGPPTGEYKGREKAMPDMGRDCYWSRTTGVRGKVVWHLMKRRSGFDATPVGIKVEAVEVMP